MAAVEDDDTLRIGSTVLTPGQYWLDNPDQVADAQEHIDDEHFEIAHRRPTEETEPFQPPPQRLTLTVEEAATLLGISRASAYEAVRKREIPSLRVGKRILVPRSQLQRLVDTDESRIEGSGTGSA